MLPSRKFLAIFLSWIILSLETCSQLVDNPGISFVILSQANKFHKRLSSAKEYDLMKQARKLNMITTVYTFPEDFNDTTGYWTIFPLLKRLSEFTEYVWLFFLEDITYVNVKMLLDVITKYNATEEVFGGYALKDNQPTIIHHFAEADEETGLLYPHFSAGFFMSYPLVERLASRLPLAVDDSFSIDPKYELSKFIWNEGNGTKLVHEPRLCLKRNSETCASWIDDTSFDCGPASAPSRIFFAMKTCHKYYRDRVPIVKKTWGSDVNYLNIFSDTYDPSIPTVKVNVENVPTGHCEKTLAIMRHYIERKITLSWLVIVDDDTLISFQRLKKLLFCYDPSEYVALGERYGYSVASGFGYDYITGGGGMVFSYPAMKKIAKSCHCPSIDSPDDMILGLCLKKLGIPILHAPYFHQARPVDYSPDFLMPLKHISFHKHWMINPYEVFQDWLQDFDLPTFKEHTEL